MLSRGRVIGAIARGRLPGLAAVWRRPLKWREPAAAVAKRNIENMHYVLSSVNIADRVGTSSKLSISAPAAQQSRSCADIF